MDASSRSFGRFGRNRCDGPLAFRPIRVRAHPAAPRGLAEEVTAGWGNTSAGDAETPTGCVLVVGFDSETGSMLRFCLQQEGYGVVEAANGTEAVEATVHAAQVTAVIIDLDMQEAGGFALLHQLRGHTRSHIIVLSRSQEERRKLRALDGGANDYVHRPFSMAELAARLRAATRFAPTAPAHIFRLGDLNVDLSSHTVKVGDRSVSLTATEFSLLELFVRNAGKVLTHAQILREIWGPKMLNRLEYLRVYLKSLREKLEANPDMRQLLLTIRSVGYRLATAER